MTDKEQIIIHGVDVSECIDFNKRDKISCYHLLYDKCNEVPNCYFKQLARKTQECEKLEDFRTLAREVFTFGDSDVDDENFIKYLQEYSRSYEEAIDGYYRLTDITGIDYTVHGGADIEEIIKRVDILKQECEELKRKVELMMDCPDCKVDEYKKALEEIEGIIKSSTKDFNHIDWEAKASHALTAVDKISDIINKARGGEDAQTN